MKPLPPGPWEVLFERALRLVDDIQQHGGLADPFWTFGGGTVLMFRYGHRLSKDIDIFVPDPQYLGYVTPRLSDTAAALTEDYTEMPGAFVKLQFDEGEIDFVAAPNLTQAAWEWWEIQGRPVRVETAAEVMAKKMFHRGDRATARDLFDLAMVVEREPDALAASAPFLKRHLDQFLAQIRQPGPGFVASFEAIAATGYRPSLERCVQMATRYLSELKP
ncbi:nucleotidyl transferase AbiEii/AbiGii toxin family protein [Ideonella sp. 4Y11]|uniref:Nucleotidyl transferase AbiEii/AbiGii toxin family protein n=1 Tax=Ideonella aquatica TaxID=2824119 RepID=A0A941BJ19_9BURK|nr:nucleotidyl transferase AbiEii/AbiGii toxin family protein [Ideonella aquatica]MBQ0959127.1 nucleotidyl transferase AbiEii/AbiGii toxin family protein [Ideonella aquatica]